MSTQYPALIIMLPFFSALFVFVIGGVWLVYTRFALDVRSAALHIPLGYVYLVLPLSGLLIIFFAIDNIAGIIRDGD